MASRIPAVTHLVLLFLAVAAFAAAKGRDDGLCGLTEKELNECKTAVATGTATPPPPTSACCAALLHADVACFCKFKNNWSLPYLGINATRAMQLPYLCDPHQTAHC